MSKFIVTYGDRVVLDYTNSPEGVHKTFGDQISAIRYILASEGVYFRPEYFEIVVEKMAHPNGYASSSADWCRYSIDWTLDEILQDVYKKFHHRFEMYKIYAVVSDI
jgi:hypothetical protein